MTRPVRCPRRLRTGEVVAVVSPCGPVLDHGLLDHGIAAVRSWGLDVVEGAHARVATGHLAGVDAQRVHDLNAAIADPDVRAVWMTRGGYGLTRIVDQIDWATLAADPKLVVGFSDVSALLVAAWQRIGLVGVHGPFIGRLAALPQHAQARVRAVLFGADGGVLTGAPLTGAPRRVVRAPLVGGNLTVLAALAGTPDQVDAQGCVVLLEEVGEVPYRVDRLLTQLRYSGALDGVAGIAVGAIVRCDPPSTRPSGTVDDVLRDRLGDLGVPVLTGLPIGHVPDQQAILHGGQVTLDCGRGTMTLRTRLRSA
jgi:muramoyltetrapeptide carboxypeptidase